MSFSTPYYFNVDTFPTSAIVRFSKNSTAINYIIEYKIVNDDDFILVGTSPILDNDHYHLTITNLLPQTLYLFSVKAVYTLGESNRKLKRVDTKEYLLQTPSNIRVSNIEETSVTLTWNGDSHATDYLIEYSLVATD